MAATLTPGAAGRARRRISPGLCRIGRPGASSPALVTADYKLSVDAVRRHLAGLDVWLLVLETKGVNGWCAAVRRIQAVGLAQTVSHRVLALPQRFWRRSMRCATTS